MVLLRLGLRVEELQRLRVVVGEGFRADPQLVALNVSCEAGETVRRILARRIRLQAN